MTYAQVRQAPLLRIFALLLGVAGCIQLGQSYWIKGKAILAQYLIADAWDQSLQQANPVRPWSWADTWPVAKLSWQAGGQQWYILDGVHGQALAFGPGRVAGTVDPGEPGLSIVAGHRDTHFAAIQSMRPGAILQAQSRRGHQALYRVSSTEVIDTREQPYVNSDTLQGLVLVTCYPFEALRSGGPYRYVVRADALL